MIHKIYNGLKSWYVDDSEQWRSLSTNNYSDTYKLYTKVPYLYRTIDIRAKAISNMPYSIYRNGNDVSDNEIYQSLIEPIRRLLYRTEGSLCLYGRSYWTKDIKNRMPLPIWLLPTLIQPYYESGRGLIRYDYYASIDSEYSSKHIQFKPEELVRFEPGSLGSEGYWNIAPAYVAAMSASTLYEIDKFASKYFGSGAIKATLLSVEGHPTERQRDELRHWYENLVSGISKAWSTAVLNNKVEPKIIGEGIAELKDSDIVERREKHICAALGVPHSLVSADAANYATSFSDRLNFYMTTIVPETEFIFTQINDQILSLYGLELIAEPRKLEVYQQQELEKAQALNTLVGSPIMLRDEARMQLELEPVDTIEETPIEEVETINTEEEENNTSVRSIKAVKFLDAIKHWRN